MPTISLMSFLKILAKGSPQKIQEYGKYLKPGGYQFYWKLKDSAQGITVGGKSYDECVKSVETISRDVERECNLAALKGLQGWIKKHPPGGYFAPPVGNCTSPAGYLTVKLEPEFGMIHSGHKRIVQLWYSKNVSLSKSSVMLGNHLIKKYLCIGEFSGCKAGILDLRKKELFILDSGTPSVLDMMIASEFAWADSFFKAQEDATKAA